ncbi:hypothetical protein [Flagellimonas meridianipacifica]|uniref:Uncharacterized protein n=1 Tax=Flagellimonas meridianipacifica TaxID=1080225 RepID=A0A2T0MIG6_9FLAO|nr:hypothetical protein [Allomuricauda pacifica]PRX57349.1 hypothetical protein CLV81_1353 [Allomuricauda pacifica]
MNFKDEFQKYDIDEENNLRYKRDLEERLSKKSRIAFYERPKSLMKGNLLFASALFATSLFLIHFVASFFENENVTANTIIEDFSFFISILCGVGFYLINLAADKLRSFIVNLVDLTRDVNREKAESFFKIYITDFLSKKRQLLFGLIFGALNVIVALILGVCYQEMKYYYVFTTLMIQIFIIGFIGGISVNQTIVVLKLIDKISVKDDINLKHFYPDKCAGTLIIGDILFRFSIYFITIGIFIFIFMHNFEWTNLKNGFAYKYYVKGLAIFWEIFPFLLAAAIFFLPAKKINSILDEYKVFEQLKIRKRLKHLSDLMLDLKPENPDSKQKLKVLNHHFKRLEKIDSSLEELNTWPYDFKYRATFLSVFIPVCVAVILEITKQIISNFLQF